LADPDERCFVIAGTSQETIVAANLRDGQFEYTIRRDGDGTVPLESARWPRAQTWYVAESHGALTNNNTVLAAVDEILRSGTTDRLTQHPPGVAAAATRVVTDNELRAEAVDKVRWESLSLDSRRRILEPVLTAEFRRPIVPGSIT
jgi:hypothetical protein